MVFKQIYLKSHKLYLKIKFIFKLTSFETSENTKEMLKKIKFNFFRSINPLRNLKKLHFHSILVLWVILWLYSVCGKFKICCGSIIDTRKSNSNTLIPVSLLFLNSVRVLCEDDGTQIVIFCCENSRHRKFLYRVEILHTSSQLHILKTGTYPEFQNIELDFLRFFTKNEYFT